jgi:hypothetical protein
VKCEIPKCPGIGPIIIAHGHMEREAINKGKRLLSDCRMEFSRRNHGHQIQSEFDR